MLFRSHVTLDVANAAQLHELGVVAGQTGAGHTLGAAGLDAVELQLGGQEQLDALLSSTTLKDDLAAVRADGVSVTTIDVGGHGVVGHVSIDESQAGALINAGLHFAAGDEVTLQAAGTHLGTSLKELQKLGVDAVTVAGATELLPAQLDVGLGADGQLSASGLPLFGDVNHDGVVDAKENAALHVTLDEIGRAHV